ncbi:hypothetical protein Poli38472_003620 [Pythium oligandrum]|uniref:DUF6818 domain-containing protein n=1 Tax=Pythium oligandrum TaxID=41045 RepID=A0A8K1CNI3_PYTOL|nr:hypothetical protein Poli38472_003620 [Pythium oligandrum]|eukprot:TMW65855.1 hypothetical protein Poli38472_003620 [Pythium oligandrum]
MAGDAQSNTKRDAIMNDASSTPSNKVLVSLFYEEPSPENPHHRRCLVCGEKKARSFTTGYRNLVRHLNRVHEGYLEVAERCLATGQTKATRAMFMDTSEVAVTPPEGTSIKDASVQYKAPVRRGGGRGGGTQAYNADDIDALLTCVEDLLPCTADMWNQVQTRYNETYAKPNGRTKRSMTSMRVKFSTFLVSETPVDDPNCPSEVRRAREIKQKLQVARGSRPKAAGPTIKRATADKQLGTVSSDDETLPDDDLATYAAEYDSDYIPERSQVRVPKPKRPRLRKTSAPSQDLHKSLAARVSAMENEFLALRNEFKSIYEVALRTNASVKKEMTRTDVLLDAFVQYKRSMLRQQANSTGQEASEGTLEQA